MNKLTKGAAYAHALARESREASFDLLRLVPRLGLEIREVNADGFDGALVRSRNLPCGTIAIRKSIREEGRKNFTIAHEIGHFLLPGHDRADLVCTKWDIGNWAGDSRRFEREADEFAAEALMPAAAIRTMVDSNRPSLQLIEKIAKHFRTSLSASAWRYCDFATEPCAIVWSTDGHIDWSKRSETFVYSLRKDAPLRQGTWASRAFKGDPCPKELQRVSGHLWTSALAQHLELWEQSKSLPAYRSVISLLLA